MHRDHFANIPSIGISEDGVVVATGSIDKTVRVYRGGESTSLKMPQWVWSLLWITSGDTYTLVIGMKSQVRVYTLDGLSFQIGHMVTLPSVTTQQ